MSSAILRRRRAVDGVRVVASLLLVAAAACGRDSPPSVADAKWAVVQEHLDQQVVWEEQVGGVPDMPMAGEVAVDEQQTRRAEAAQVPDVTAAVAAARELVAAGGPYTIESAEFLITRTPPGVVVVGERREERLEELAEAGAGLRAAEDALWELLIAKIGPDWTVVQDYLDQRAAWFQRLRQAVPTQSAAPLGPSTQDRPSAVRAVAAARAILAAEEAHEKSVEAAEFLGDSVWDVPRGDLHAVVGARWLVAHAPDDYEGWPGMWQALDAASGPMGMGATPDLPIELFMAETASDADSPILRAAARYHLAAGLMRAAKRSWESPGDLAARRGRALQQAAGLSRGVEDETFDDWMPPVRTFAQAEADLIASIEHATAGGTLPEWTGRRLDRTEEPLSAYRGRVLLIDFWATWCAPCIDALPKLRDMVAELPPDRFALLAISVDEELETVTEFMKREAMPWHNWHVGASSEIEQILDVRGFPTYLLADENGVVLSNGAPLAKLRCMAARKVAGEEPDCPVMEWFGAE